MPESDVQSLRGWRRLAHASLLLCLVVWMTASFLDTRGADRIGFGRTHPWAWWMGAWEMFTSIQRRHRVMDAEGYWGDPRRVPAEPIALGALFPTRWGGGLRFERPEFLYSDAKLAVVAHAVCVRQGGADPERGVPTAVALYSARWEKTLGQREQPRGPDLTRDRVMMWPCDRDPPRPPGVVW